MQDRAQPQLAAAPPATGILTDGRLRLAGMVAAAVLVVDQITKAIVQANMTLFETIPLTPWFALTYVRNRGAAFSLFATMHESVRIPIFLAVTVVAVVALVSYLRATPPDRPGMVAALGGILGGAVGNFICRARYGEVVDFLLLHWRDLQWPAFNVADSAISVGVVVLLIGSFRADGPQRAAG